MDKVLTISRSDAEQLRMTLKECITEIDRLREMMQEDDIRIAKSQARTYAIMAEMDAVTQSKDRQAA